LVTDCEPAPPLPAVDAGVVVVALVELELELGAAAAVDELELLLLPQPAATMMVAISAAPSNPLRALVVTFSSFRKCRALTRGCSGRGRRTPQLP
jgi:hypothetical protein